MTPIDHADMMASNTTTALAGTPMLPHMDLRSKLTSP